MKKTWLLSLFLGALLTFIMPHNIMAVQQIAVTLDGQQLQFDVSPVLDNNRVLVPLRTIFEALGATVSWDVHTKSIYVTRDNDTIKLVIGEKTAYKNSSAVELDVPAKVVERRTLVPLRFISEALGASVEWDNQKQTVTIHQTSNDTAREPNEDHNSPLLKAEYTLDEHIATLRIPGLVLVGDNGGQLYETRYLGGTKYLIKFDSIKGNVNVEQIVTNDYMVQRISISTDISTKKTTIVIESEGRLFFKRNSENEKTDFEIAISTRPFIDHASTKEHAEPGTGDDTVNTDMDRTGNNNVTGFRVGDISTIYTNKFSYDEVSIDLSNSTSFNVHRMSEPERIVIDINGLYLDSSLKTIQLNATYVEKIRYARFQNNVLRVVLDLKNPPGFSDTYSPQNGYSYEVKDGRLIIRVEKRTFDRLYYSNISDRVYLLMAGEHITKGEYNLSENQLYTSSYNSSTGIYTISYDSVYRYNGRMLINDSYIEHIDISTVGSRATMRIKYKDKSIAALPITRYRRSGSNFNYWHSTITFLKPKKPGERLIVIDPGHGGIDPGAVANGVRESDLNLDIAKRLKSLFAGSNVRIYMTRGDDSYIGLGERTAVANLMDADLFLSIHNNAYYAAFSGTETYYYTTPQVKNGISAAEFATVLQKHLLADLGLINRGVKQNTFSVLRHSSIPSALIEIAFLTNLSDVAKLKDTAFRQKAALALYKALIETIAKIK